MSVVAVVADKGYTRATIGDVLKRARISRETFYQHFTDKQDCFLTAFDQAADLFIAAIHDAMGSPGDPVLLRLGRALDTYLGVLAAQPAMARTFLIEVYGAGHEAVTRRIGVQERFAATIAEAITHGQRLKPGLNAQFVGRAVIGAVSALVTAYADAGEYAKLPELRGQIVDLVAALVE